MPKRSKRSRDASERYVKMTISVPPALRDAMRPFDGEVNWSFVAARAFRDRLALLKVSVFKGPEAHLLLYLESVRRGVESKVLREHWMQIGRDTGIDWALGKATDEQLRRFSAPADEVFVSDFPIKDFMQVLQPRDEAGRKEVESMLADADHPLCYDHDFLRAFYEGARGVWRRIQSRPSR